MADALISIILQQLTSIFESEIHKEVKLVLGTKKEIENLTTTLTAIKAVLNDAEKKQMKETSIRVWLQQLKDISYELDDVLDEWYTKILQSNTHEVDKFSHHRKKVNTKFLFPCFCFNEANVRHDIGIKVKHIKEKLDLIASEKERYNFDLVRTAEEELCRTETTSLVDVSDVCGRDSDKDMLVSMLCESSDDENGIGVMSIVGMGGIGKTTLAQVVFNDERVKFSFQKRIWVCVSEPFNQIQIAKTILQGLGVDALEFLRWPNLQELLCSSITGMKFLLVLDDVWTDDYNKWEPLKLPLKHGGKGSRILMTTRNSRVSRMLEATHMITLGKLSVEDSWSLFSRLAFSSKGRKEYEKLEEIGRKIADKCKGLPLAVKTLGSLMRFKETKQDWKNVLESETWELEEVERGIFPPLLLSYYDLSSPMKQCFSYCAIFPKDYEIEKDSLIKLWMAQGFLGSNGTAELELKGAEYFDNLVMRSFFQDLERNKDDGSIVSCKMHDIVHDFAHFLTKNECFVMNVDGNREMRIDPCQTKIRHLTLIGVREDQFRPSIYSAKNLRTLQVLQIKTRTTPSALFHHLTSLRALDLSHTSTEKLPSEVGKLIHLRYLDLSYLDFEELPDAVCNLYNLQTLNLNWCKCLHKLPKSIGKLINLRHLNIEWTDWLSILPQGIGKLSALRTLSKFIVSSNQEGCTIADLKNLNHLRGHIEISGLEKVTDVEETKKADLMSKNQLQSLDLVFSFGVKEVMENVIEALQPQPNLEELQVYDYGGSVFPSWMMKLNKLKDLRLLRCENCVQLPPLGNLQSLERLLIGHLTNLKFVGSEFLGLPADDGNADNDTGSVIVFPKLKELTFRFMVDLEEWDISSSSSSRSSSSRVTVMPCLSSLSLYDCPKLKALPQHIELIPLEELIIQRCPILEQLYQRDGENWSKLSHISDIQI